jgi:hypothetical protein
MLCVCVCACARVRMSQICLLAACRLMRHLEEPEPRPEQMEMGSLFRLIHRCFSPKALDVFGHLSCQLALIPFPP